MFRVFLLLIGLPVWSLAQSALTVPSLYPLGQQAYSQHFRDPFSLLANPAVLARTRSGFGLYSEHRFMLRELYTMALSVNWAQLNYGVGLLTNYFGNESYHHWQSGLCYGRSVGNIDLGISIQITQQKVLGLKSQLSLQSSIGLCYVINEHWVTGFLLHNIWGSRLSSAAQLPIYRRVDWGWGYELSEDLLLTASLRKIEGQPLAVIYTLEYRLPAQFFIRAGGDTGTASRWIGVGGRRQQWQLVLLTQYHGVLGYSPGVFLIYDPAR